MRNFKTLLLSLITVGTIGIGVLTGCSPESDIITPPTTSYCDTAVCPPNSTCDTVNNACICEAGYSGANCQTLWRNALIGLVQVRDQVCTYNPGQETINVSASSEDVTGITISKVLNGTFTNVKATMVSEISFTMIPGQTGVGEYVIVSGEGTFVSNRTWSISYTITSYLGDTTSCTANWIK